MGLGIPTGPKPFQVPLVAREPMIKVIEDMGHLSRCDIFLVLFRILQAKNTDAVAGEIDQIMKFLAPNRRRIQTVTDTNDQQIDRPIQAHRPRPRGRVFDFHVRRQQAVENMVTKAVTKIWIIEV